MIYTYQQPAVPFTSRFFTVHVMLFGYFTHDTSNTIYLFIILMSYWVLAQWFCAVSVNWHSCGMQLKHKHQQHYVVVVVLWLGVCGRLLLLFKYTMDLVIWTKRKRLAIVCTAHAHTLTMYVLHIHLQTVACRPPIRTQNIFEVTSHRGHELFSLLL